MKKTILISAATALLCLTAFFGCEKDDNIVTNDNQISDVENLQIAQDWFNNNTNGFIPFNLNNSDKKRNQNLFKILFPYWNDIQFSHSINSNTVEAGLYTILNNEILPIESCATVQFTKNNEENDIRSISKFVIKTDENTNETSAFIMIIDPDDDNTLTNQELQKITYYNRNNKFSGQIVYHNLKGKYTNSWVYMNGQIVKGYKVSKTKHQQTRGWVNVLYETCWYTLTGPSMEQLTIVNRDCYLSMELEYVDEIEADSDPKPSGGGGGGYLPIIDINEEAKEKIKNELCDAISGIINLPTVKDKVNNLTKPQEQFIISLANLAAFSELGLMSNELKSDLVNFPKSSELYSKYNKLNNSQKYIGDWSTSINSSSNSNEAFISPEINNSNYQLKFYPEKNGENSAVGLVKEGIFDHSVEAALEYIERWYIDNKDKPDDFMYDMHLYNAVNFMEDYCNE